MENKRNLAHKGIVALILGIIAIHMYIIGFITQSVILISISAIDALIAFLLGITTDNDYGHAGLIIGLLVLIILVITLFIVN
ncbi:MAG TPA: hypothetical protein IAA29_08470 [Candidatus Paenibacillus intestinavium]|nr:hypothetical protein [Candidatus Paenibacillus intestinavium]